MWSCLACFVRKQSEKTLQCLFSLWVYLSHPHHFCPLGGMIVTHVALFARYSSLTKKYNVKANRTT